MVAKIDVQEALTRVTGLDPLQLNDILVDAPEPAKPGDLSGLRTVGANLLYLFEKLPDAIWNDPGSRLMEARAHRYIGRLSRRQPDDSDRDFPFKVQPKPYQLNIFAAARYMSPFVALAPVAPGTGKTKMTIDICASKFLDGEIDGVAVIAAPGAVPSQWIDEALPDHMTTAVKWIGATWKSTRKTDKRIMSPHTKQMRWLTFKVEAFSGSNSKAAKALTEYLKSGKIALVWDESSRGKNPRAARTKAILEIGPLAVFRMILSGTPITKGMEDLWSQYEFGDPQIIGMSNYYAFRGRYCVTVPSYKGAPRGAVKIAGYRNTEEFVRKIAGVTFVVPKDVLGLPPKTYEELPVELTRDQKMAYNALRHKLVDDLADMGIASPVNAAVRLCRLQQVLCGRVYEQPSDLEEPPFAKDIPSHRIDTLLEYIDLNEGPNVIWCRFTDDILGIEAALKKAGRSPVVYYGDVSDEDRDARKRAFITGKATDFVANPATAGMGLDKLQTICQRSIWYSNSFNRESRWQGEDRIHRLGMCGTALNVDMIAPNTVDRLILASYKKTEDLIRSIMARPELVPVLNDE